MKAIRGVEETLGASFEIEDIPEDMADQAEEYRMTLVELAVEQDETALEAYLEGNEPDADTLRACIRKGTLERAFVPVLTGSAFKNKGVQPLLDAVVNFMPSPTDIGATAGMEVDSEEAMERAPSDSEPFSALAFKGMTDPFVGSLTFARVYSGVMESGS